jgi:hypothetical protein
MQHFGYIDAFSGAGVHVSKRTGGQVEGAPTSLRFAIYHVGEGLQGASDELPEIYV